MGSGASKEALQAAQATKSNKKFSESYQLTKELGSGAFSIVKLGISKADGQHVAVKVITKKKLTEEDKESLLVEINILKSLNHPNIIKLYETFEDNNDYFIVTELVEGGELFDRIVAKSHYTEAESRELIRCFLETMNFMHSNGIVHRDLKPENLLLKSHENDSEIKICDFGFAKRVVDLLPKEVACGTPGYVAPEILRGDPYGTEVDIWSMGVICYVLMVGYPPFYDEDQKKLFRKIKEGRYHFHEDYWCNISPEAMDLIRKMLCVSQRERWTAEQLLKHPWFEMGHEHLAAKDLSTSLVTMKKYLVRRRFKASVNAVILANRLSHFRFTEVDPTIAEAADDIALDDEHTARPPVFHDEP